MRFKLPTMSAWLAAYCRREWAKSPECHGLSLLCLAQRRAKLPIDSVTGVISQYLVPYELAVCVRSEFPRHRSHFQVVDPRSKEIVATQILAGPRRSRRRLTVDLVAVAEDLGGYAVIWHDVLHWGEYRMLEVFTLGRASTESFSCSKFSGTGDADMSVCALKFSSTNATLLACSAGGETRMYRVDFLTECMTLIWKRLDTCTEQLRFWGGRRPRCYCTVRVALWVCAEGGSQHSLRNSDGVASIQIDVLRVRIWS